MLEVKPLSQRSYEEIALKLHQLGHPEEVTSMRCYKKLLDLLSKYRRNPTNSLFVPVLEKAMYNDTCTALLADVDLWKAAGGGGKVQFCTLLPYLAANILFCNFMMCVVCMLALQDVSVASDSEEQSGIDDIREEYHAVAMAAEGAAKELPVEAPARVMLIAGTGSPATQATLPQHSPR